MKQLVSHSTLSALSRGHYAVMLGLGLRPQIAGLGLGLDMCGLVISYLSCNFID